MTDLKQDQGIQEVQTTTLPTEDTQQAPMPSANKDTVETEQVTQAPDQSEEEITLPEEVSTRTREQFEKLKARYEEKLQKAVSKQVEPQVPELPYSNVFDTFRPQEPVNVSQQPQAPIPNLTNQQVAEIRNQFVDEFGNVDINGLNSALSTASKQSQQAMQRAQQAEERLMRYEETQQVREAHTTHPELDPKNKTFDPKFFELVRDRLLRNMYEGKQHSLLEVANDIRDSYQPAKPVNLEKVKEEAVTQYKEVQQARVQGPIEAGKGESRIPTVTQDEMRERTRQENPFRASPNLDERLRNVGVIKKH